MQRPESTAIRGTGQTLQWVATDTADGVGAWFVERRPDERDLEAWTGGRRDGDRPGPVAAADPDRRSCSDRDATGITIDGDAPSSSTWIDNTAHSAD